MMVDEKCMMKINKVRCVVRMLYGFCVLELEVLVVKSGVIAVQDESRYKHEVGGKCKLTGRRRNTPKRIAITVRQPHPLHNHQTLARFPRFCEYRRVPTTRKILRHRYCYETLHSRSSLTNAQLVTRVWTAFCIEIGVV